MVLQGGADGFSQALVDSLLPCDTADTPNGLLDIETIERVGRLANM